MNPWPMVLATPLLVGAVMLYWRHNRAKNELFVEQLLFTLSERSRSALVTEDPCVKESSIRQVRVIGKELAMTYASPVGKNAFGGICVFSGTLRKTTEYAGRKFSSIEFEIAHGREAEFPHREGLSYQIMLLGEKVPPKKMSGIVGEDTLKTSLHVPRFVEVVVAIHGAR